MFATCLSCGTLRFRHGYDDVTPGRLTPADEVTDVNAPFATWHMRDEKILSRVDWALPGVAQSSVTKDVIVTEAVTFRDQPKRHGRSRDAWSTAFFLS